METDKKVRVSMLGGFEVSYENCPVSLSKFKASKAQELFQLLMLHLDTGIPKNKIQQSLYSWDEGNDRNDSMNSLLYRLKQHLHSAGILHDEYVTVKNGVCKWTDELPTEVDTIRFERLVGEAQRAETNRKRELLTEAFSLYKGETLAGVPSKTWIIEERLRLKKVFEVCVRQLGYLLESQEDYETAYAIYAKAAQLYPFDEWQIKQIDMLQEMERYEDAYVLYKSTVQKYFDDLGLPPSQRMLDKIQSMSINIRNKEQELREIKNVLDEGVPERGAYYCTYPSFVDSYRFISRTVERSGQSIFFMVCSVRYLDPAGRKSPKAGDMLLRAIESSLRRGDIFSRYSNNQYLILLSGTQNENCEMIFERIRKEFKKINRNTNCDLEYNVSELLELTADPEPIRFKSKKNRW
ncbi:MAG: hypothetical protein IJO55_04900 [Lachnospiraceae bacterium]|nr:hypothetical protein [Lachnospiraceae bacterium]